MSESKSIIDLCRSLPNSEPELRARALDFTRAVCVQVMGWQEVADVSEIPAERTSDTVYFEPFAGVVGDVSGNDVGSVLVYAGGDAYKFNPMVYIADAKVTTDQICQFLQVPFQVEWFNNKWRASFYFKSSFTTRFITVFTSTEELARSAACVLAAEAMRQSAK